MKINVYKTKKRIISYYVSSLLTASFALATVNLYSQSLDTSFQGPIVITKGGTYSGKWESKDSNVPAVHVKTSEPVIIENSTIRSAGNLIYTVKDNCDLIIRNTSGYGTTPSIDNKSKGRFLFCHGFKRVIVENNYMESTAGILVENFTGSGDQTETVRVRYNKAKNIDGRFRNGGKSPAQFFILTRTRDIKNVEIAWNEVINLPSQCSVEDNINIHRSSGTKSSVIKIHNNYIQGAYPLDLNDPKFPGGGIMLADGQNGEANEASAYVTAYENHIVSTTNYGVAIAGGNNNLAYKNRVISSGIVKYDGKTLTLPSQNVGIYIANVTNTVKGAFYNNSARENYVGFVNPKHDDRRNDYYLKQGVNCSNNKSISGTVTYDMEQSEHELWQSEVEAAGKRIGVQPGSVETELGTDSTIKLNVYPNPTKDYLTIESEELDIKTIVTIWSSKGDLIVGGKELDSFYKKAVIDLTQYNLVPGIFFVKIQNGETVYQERLVLN